MISGKLTIAYKVLVVGLNASADPDYLQRYGINQAQFFLVHPPTTQIARLLVDLVEAGP